MDTTKLYLVTVLIEIHGEPSTDSHILCKSLDKAKKIMKTEIHAAKALFLEETGFLHTDNEYCQEWRNEDGFGYTIGVEEIALTE